MDVSLSSLANAEFKEVWDNVTPFINTFYGLAMLGLSLSLGVTLKQFQGTDYLLMIQNIFSFIPFIFKPLGIGDEDATPNKLALGIIDGVCDLTVLGLAVAQSALPPAPTPTPTPTALGRRAVGAYALA